MPHVGIGYIKNNTQIDLGEAEWGKIMTDSILCNARVNILYIQPGESEPMETGRPDGELSKLPDSSKQVVYVFNMDSVNKYRKLKLCDGIVKHCLVKQLEIQLNKVKEPFDTISINSSKPSN